MQHSPRKSMLCPNCRKLISADERRCPHCGIAAPGARWKNNPLTRGWGSGRQLVKYIIFTNVGLYLFSLLVSKGVFVGGLNPLTMLSPSRLGVEILGATSMTMLTNVGWWTLVSANYLHGSALHIFFNMMALNQLGLLIAQLYGSYRFFVIYALSGVGGFLVSCLIGDRLTVGASAALFGLIGAALYYGKSRGGTFGQAVYRQIGGWAVVIIVIGFVVPQVDNAAHIGGLLTGALTANLLGYHEKQREKMLHRTAAAACVAVTILVLAWSVLRGFIFLFAY